MNQILDLQTMAPEERPEADSLLTLCGHESTASLLLCV